MSNIFSSITQLGAIITDAMVKVLDRTITVTTLLNAVAVPGPSASQELGSVNKAFQIVITGAAVVAIEVSNDGVTFVSTFPQASATALLINSDPWKFIRVNVISITSGTVTVVMSSGAGP